MPEAAAPASRRGGPARISAKVVDAAYAGFAVAAMPWALARVAVDSRARARWFAYLRDVRTRFGPRRARDGDRPCVWVHGVSVGEVKAAARLVEAVEAAVEGVEVVVTSTTDTGHRVARERYPGRRVDFWPPDFSWIVRGALDRIRPDLVLLVESELWPNFLLACRDRGIPVALVNGRISERSRVRFRRAGRVTRGFLEALDRLCVQSPADAERFLSIGVAPERLAVTGNVKLDNVPLVEDRARSERYARLLGVDGGAPLLVAGSTHPGEEKALGEIVRRVRADGRALRLVVAPRHPGRADDAEDDLTRSGLAVVRRSRLDGGPPPRDAVVLLDTVGELESVYSVADVVFVGGSLVRHGGHNMMEPASLGKPVVVGPHAFNFRGESDLLVAAGGLAVVADAEEAEARLREWLSDPGAAAAVGERARAAILASKGATERTLEVLRPMLSRLARPPRARVKVS
jgi:3-deoxy-D-manno-octulosonic-acid transferase